MRWIFITALIACSVVGVHASEHAPGATDFSNTGVFYRMCKGDLVEDDPDITIIACMSYLEGAIEAYSTYDQISRDRPGFCFPSRMTPEDLRRVFVTWVDDHPDARDQTRKITVFVALFKTYGCK